MNRAPNLAELRTRVFKHSSGGAEIGSWPARKIARPSAVFGTWIAVRFGLSAHAVTLMSLISALLGALAIGMGTRPGFVAGVLLLNLAYWLDHVDGQVARWRNSASLDGVYLDYLMHHAQAMTLGFALGFGLALRTGEIAWTCAGLLMALGWTLLNLHNDCRFKAFFQKLKKDGHHRRVEGGPQGRPQPAPGWPRRGMGVVSWPAQKICEPHVVLVGMNGLMILGLFSGTAWEICWKCGAAGMACLAPALAVARSTKAVARSSLESEFDRWFPRDETPLAARTGGAARV